MLQMMLQHVTKNRSKFYRFIDHFLNIAHLNVCLTSSLLILFQIGCSYFILNIEKKSTKRQKQE